MARAMKDSGVEWIGQIPEEWEIVRFKYLHNSANTGESIDKELCSSSQIGHLFYTAGLKPIYTSYEEFPDWKYTRERDLLLARNGTPYIYLPQIKAVYSDHIIRVDIKNDYVKRFIRYCLQNSISAEIVDSVSLATWSISLWNKQILPLPTKAEQTRIADFLDQKCSAIDSVLEKTKASIDEYKKLKQSVITQTVTKGIQPNRPMKDSGIEWIGQIPEDWKVIKLKNINTKITDGSHFSPVLTDAGKKYITVSDLYDNIVHYEKANCISENDFNDLCKNGCKPELDDVLLTKDGTVGRTAVVKNFNDYVLLSSIGIYRPDKKRVLPFFFKYLLDSHFLQEQMKLSMAGSALRRITVSKMKEYQGLLPPLTEQQTIADYLDKKCAEIDNIISKKEQLIKEVETYKKSLIYEYVTGKKEVI